MNSFSHELSHVLILAGGFGTRLATRLGNMPKPMAPILGKPLLQHQLELCREHGFIDISLLVHHRHEVISEYFGDGREFGVRLRYEVESVPRGTSGALRDALPRMAERFLVLYGDTFVDVNLRRLWNYHVSHGADATLFLHANDHPKDSDLVELDQAGDVRAIWPYPHAAGEDHRNLVNAALYVLERNGLEDFTPTEGKADIAKHMFPAMLAAGKRLQGYVSPEYVKDMGTPERLDKVESDIERGLPEQLSGRGLRSAVFLDRDGTLNVEVGHLRSRGQVELLEGAADAIRSINRSGRLAVVVTNQPVVARGDVSFDELDGIHARLEALLGARGAYVDRIYVCPHHPEKGYPGEIPSLKLDCTCRKPFPGLIEKACVELGINRARSWMIGDATADIEAGRRAGVKTILVRTGHAGRDDKNPLRPDYVCPDLPSAVAWVLWNHDATVRRLARASLEVVESKRRVVLIGGLARSGKSSAAQVLKELLEALGTNAHVLSLDSWLLPAAQRTEGSGVLSRYDIASASSELRRVIESTSRVSLTTCTYDRLERRRHEHSTVHSIGAADTLIVEGVPALLMPELAESRDPFKIYVEVSEDRRRERLGADYRWRGVASVTMSKLFDSRDKDESTLVTRSKEQANLTIASQDDT